ncbi:MAG: hypothetical protein BGN87_17550 [Rhizobiales bacterium 65-79]|nr:hypothetical protein [Hyphomicrobiales bacterium]OJU06761.1 MAG: hypothetical protein BGN87_17550 [Rhizobiales bacterium 65-79]
MRSWSLGIVAALLLADPALADPGSIRAAANSALTEAASGKPANGASLSLDEHFTTNALDSDLEFSDFYTELRGSITRVLDIDGGYLRFAAEGRASRYDRISIEDDRSLLLLAEAYRKFGGRYELRGTFAWRTASIGDDFRIADLAIGTRTDSDLFSGALQFGADLGSGAGFILTLSDTVERYGKARFQQDLIEAARIEPDRNRLQFSGGLEKKLGRQQFGLSASAETTEVQRLGEPPVGRSFSEFTLRGLAQLVSKDGTRLDLSLGAALLDEAHGGYSRIRPIYRVQLTKDLKAGLTLRGSLDGRYETIDTDDVLASYVRRIELEARYQCTPELALGTGFFRENKENLLLGNAERSKGVYFEIGYDPSKHIALVARVDLRRTRYTVFNARKTVLDTYVGMQTGL